MGDVVILVVVVAALYASRNAVGFVRSHGKPVPAPIDGRALRWLLPLGVIASLVIGFSTMPRTVHHNSWAVAVSGVTMLLLVGLVLRLVIFGVGRLRSDEYPNLTAHRVVQASTAERPEPEPEI
jgi:hypothetical protein